MQKKTIQFTVDAVEKDRLNTIAIKKGFSSAAAMARFTMYSYLNKHPSRKRAAIVSDPIKNSDNL